MEFKTVNLPEVERRRVVTRVWGEMGKGNSKGTGL
jgi:hypothetical protein